MEQIEAHRCFGGTLSIWKHRSASTGTDMRFSVFVPPGQGPFPLFLWLSGLTCTEENFTIKAGAYRRAAELGLVVVAPDTSPRGPGVADDAAYDLGQGAGFYVDATQAPWSPHFRMYSYVADELPALLDRHFPLNGQRGISGHSMGGHGALTIALRNPDKFRSVSAMAPIVSPTRTDWGRKALTAYLGADPAAWARHDATLLLQSGAAKGRFDDMLVDQGLADQFLAALQPHLLEEAAAAAGQRVTVRRQEGYDHSYWFVQSFIADHLDFHAARLK